MANLEYSIGDLHNLFELELRNSMCINPNSDMHDIAKVNRDNILDVGNPVYNRLYKNMKVATLTNHMNFVGDGNMALPVKFEEDFDVIIDDGQIEDIFPQNKGWNMESKPKLLSPFENRSNLGKYQPYFKPTGRISDFAVAHSTGVVGLKYSNNSKDATTIAYSDYYNDKDLNCVTVVIDIGKNCSVNIDETFFNKDGLKVYKIVYLVRDYAELTLKRSISIDEKDSGANIIESNVIQFPGSTFKYTVESEGSKYTQDLMYIDVYNDCKTTVTGAIDLYGDYINNNVIDVHHIGPNSTSRVDVRSIVDDNAHSSFLGSITVDKEAINTDAQLVNKNLLLSNTATAITEPQLDINTKEIACSHGCTVSNIDKDQLYFLESRGITTNIAEETLKQCFLTM
ncbi:SufD family Fe-S cluster assembly protein [bacterium]|jgi:Fe-S cluster assembly scaffold protein SufB|nr:SufD family Fe-S cluster assembly protein [bacterium]